MDNEYAMNIDQGHLCKILDENTVTASQPLSDEQYDFLSSRMKLISQCLIQRDSYIKNNNLDNDIFGIHWDCEGVDLVANKLIACDRGMFNRLRCIYYWSGLPISIYRRREIFPVIDPMLYRYNKLNAVLPSALKIALPDMCGEAGWKVQNGLFNSDVAVTQERLAYLYFTGIYDWLFAKKQPTVLEIGAGGGLFAYGLMKAIPKMRYVICDIPDSLIVQFAYLNLVMPEQRHYVAGPDGLFEILGPKEKDKAVKLKDIEEGILYIPNYMMHKYSTLLKPDLAYNAMSLHEMHPKQIQFYTNMLNERLSTYNNGWFSQCIKKLKGDTNGIFFEINSHCGVDHPLNEPYLQASFQFKRKFNFLDLALAPTLWTNDKQLMDDFSKKFTDNSNAFDLAALFRVDVPYQFPKTNFRIMPKHVDEDLGDYIGFSFSDHMNKTNLYFADHLGGHYSRNVNFIL